MEGKLPYISRIHTAYIGEYSSILGTNEMFGDRGYIYIALVAHLEGNFLWLL